MRCLPSQRHIYLIPQHFKYLSQLETELVGRATLQELFSAGELALRVAQPFKVLLQLERELVGIETLQGQLPSGGGTGGYTTSLKYVPSRKRYWFLAGHCKMLSQIVTKQGRFHMTNNY